MLVSVTVPTWDREARLPALYAQFAQQTWPGDLELVVLDDSPAPSPFFRALRDERVRYVHDPVRATTGAKRDRLLGLARGEVHVQFDDDDRYAPAYVATALAHLGDHDLWTASAWHLHRELDGSTWYWDTRRVDDLHYIVEGAADPARPLHAIAMRDHLGSDARRAAWLDQNLWGYGFSYVYRAAPARAVGVPGAARGSDFLFVQRLRAAGARLHATPDEEGLVVHVLQATSSTRCFPQYRLPEHVARRLAAAAPDVSRDERA